MLVRIDGEPVFSYASALPDSEIPMAGELADWQGKWLFIANNTLIVDGEIMNLHLGYGEIFDWQLYHGKPVFFFERGGRYGLSYDGVELSIDWEDIFHMGCCGYQIGPFQYGFGTDNRMLVFTAWEDGVYKTIEVSPSSQAPTKNTKTSQAAIADYLAAQKNPDLNDEEKIKITIDTYFTLRYEGQKAVAAQDFSTLVEDNTLDWVKKEIDKQEIERYINCMFDTSYRSYKFNLDYSSLEIKEATAEVVLMESNEVVQSAVASQVSKLGELSHRITLHRKNGVWIIYQDEYKDDYTELIASSTKAEIKKQIDKNYTANGKNNLDTPEAEKCQNIIH